jgi:hypothetical protein
MVFIDRSVHLLVVISYSDTVVLTFGSRMSVVLLGLLVFPDGLDEEHEGNACQHSDKQHLHDEGLLLEQGRLVLGSVCLPEVQPHLNHQGNHRGGHGANHHRVVGKPLEDDEEVHESKEGQ